MKTRWVLCVGMLLTAMCVRSGAQTSAEWHDDRIQVVVPSGWVAKQVTETTVGDQVIKIPIGGVLMKGRYRIYLLTHHGQASGIDGGRFSEIAGYVSPWMKVDGPWGCYNALQDVSTPATDRLSRRDLFFDSRSASSQHDPECKTLHAPVETPVWFGSYFTKRCLISPEKDSTCNGFFLTFPLSLRSIEGADDEMAFTVTIDTTDAATLPAMNDPGLRELLGEVTAIVSSIRYK